MSGGWGRRSIRLAHSDYTRPGAYFVTICASERRPLFGRIRGGAPILTPLGQVVEFALVGFPDHFVHVCLDSYVIMPNHLHAILFIHGRGTACRAPTQERFGKPVPGSLPPVVRSFKSAVTKPWRAEAPYSKGDVWQRGCFEKGIRSEHALAILRQYIQQNPAKWGRDRYFTQ
jgi:REP element-mobilizing transposase RayT